MTAYSADHRNTIETKTPTAPYSFNKPILLSILNSTNPPPVTQERF